MTAFRAISLDDNSMETMALRSLHLSFSIYFPGGRKRDPAIMDMGAGNSRRQQLKYLFQTIFQAD